MKEGTLRVWWIPQVPGKPFHREVTDEYEAARVIDLLGRYDQFQYEHRIKPDYSNAGGLEVFEDGEWGEWYSEDGDDIRELMRTSALFDEEDSE